MDYGSDVGPFSSLYKHSTRCEYNLLFTSSFQFDIKLENIYIPKKHKIAVVQKSKYLKNRPIGELTSKDSGKTRYFRTERADYFFITIIADANTSFDASFRRFNDGKLFPPKSTLFWFEGPEGAKSGLGIAYFVLGKGKLSALGLAFIAKKKIRNGIKV